MKWLFNHWKDLEHYWNNTLTLMTALVPMSEAIYYNHATLQKQENIYLYLFLSAINNNMQLLLGSYYKYCTYKCQRHGFWDRTVHIFENKVKFLIFSIFHGIKDKKNAIIRYVKVKIKHKISNSTYNRTSTYNRNLRVLTYFWMTFISIW